MPEYASVPAARDRSRRLVACGIAVIGAGALGLLLGVAHLLLPLAPGPLSSAPESLDRTTILMGALLYGSLGAILVRIGIGSVRLERWVRPLMLSLAWIWLLTGLMAIPLATWMLDDLLVVVTAEMQVAPGLVTAVKAFMISALVLWGAAFPAALIWVYRDPDVGRTCEARHRTPAWTDRCPLPVLGLSVCLALAAWVALPAAFRPVVPLFGRLITGWPGSGLVLGSVVLAAALAWSTYRLRPGGWWATIVALVLFGVSTMITFGAVDPLEAYRAMGYPEEVLAAWSGSPLAGRSAIVAGTLLVTLASLVYMARIRKYFPFSPGGAPETAPSRDRNRIGSPHSGNRGPRSP